EGGRVTIEGEGFPVDPHVPHVRVGTERARVATASPSSLTVLVPEGLEGGSTAIRFDELPGETAFVEVGAPIVTGVHHVDSPAYALAFGPGGGLYVPPPTLSTNDSIYRVSRDGDVSVFASGFGRPQGLAFDSAGHLFVVDALAGSSALYRIRLDAPAAPELML